MKQLNLYYIGGGEQKPDGRTVEPTDDIQIWLKCAGLNKPYTTLSQVLADSTCLNALISDSNAVDYLVRSTTWASDVCGDSGAMSYIGLNNYASNTLLADSTWCNAICNSTYFESVLNVKVPTMTSNTTPSGEAYSNSEYTTYSAYAYKAFDGDDTSAWTTANNVVANSYVAYDFERPVPMYVAKYVGPEVAGRMKNYKIQASIDRAFTSPVDLYSGACPNSAYYESGKLLLNNMSSYRYYRLLIIDRYGSTTNLGLATLQFYGRADINENQRTVYSAANDTVYYVENGNNVTLCTTDSTGKGTVDISSLIGRELILFSTVAKNPNNLSNAYSKTITISREMTEIKVMPENSLYWWGYQNNVEQTTSDNGWTIGAFSSTNFTINANNMTCNVPGSGVSGLSSNNAITTSKVHVIARQISVSGYGGGQIRITSSKNITTSAIASTAFTTTSDITHYTTDISTPDIYPIALYYGPMSGQLNAIWYE